MDRRRRPLTAAGVRPGALVTEFFFTEFFFWSLLFSLWREKEKAPSLIFSSAETPESKIRVKKKLGKTR